MATRIDYERTAAILCVNMTRLEIACKFATLYKTDNPRFDIDRFMEAAGFSPIEYSIGNGVTGIALVLPATPEDAL